MRQVEGISSTDYRQYLVKIHPLDLEILNGKRNPNIHLTTHNCNELMKSDQQSCNAHLRPKPELIYFTSFVPGSNLESSSKKKKKNQRSSKGHHFGLLIPEKKLLKGLNHTCIWRYKI